MSSNTHDVVAHAWAHQTGKNRKGFNVFYEGDTIYSYGYHFPIARHAGDRVVLFTSRDYSVSTSKHKTQVRRAVSHRKVLEVDNVVARTEGEHVVNWQTMLVDARSYLHRSQRARKAWNIEFYAEQATTLLASMNEYAQHFGLNLPTVSVDTIGEAIAELDARRAAAREAAEAERIRRERERKVQDRDRLRAWLKGADLYPPHTPRPYVRVKGDVVETTWGAVVPLSDAKALFELASKVRSNGIPFENNARMFKVGHYVLDRIDPTGGLKVGCHSIPYRFAQLAACMAGLIKAEPMMAEA
jgi:hypothetical protein